MAEWNCVNKYDDVSFCDKCHSILDPPDKHNILKCRYCDYQIASIVRERKTTRNYKKGQVKALMNKQFNKKQIKKQLSSMNEDDEDDEAEGEVIGAAAALEVSC